MLLKYALTLVIHDFPVYFRAQIKSAPEWQLKDRPSVWEAGVGIDPALLVLIRSQGRCVQLRVLELLVRLGQLLWTRKLVSGASPGKYWTETRSLTIRSLSFCKRCCRYKYEKPGKDLTPCASLIRHT